ncbi:hypothetical protein VNO77_32660 [Canavalia gladiata]|uniref:Uncharacterized protein n=1 Tax=Canavalia gladiata TaxID=3824 RepID=A0AAN9Q4I5_CANGL
MVAREVCEVYTEGTCSVVFQSLALLMTFAMSGALAWRVRKSPNKIGIIFCLGGGMVSGVFLLLFYAPALSPFLCCVVLCVPFPLPLPLPPPLFLLFLLLFSSL